MDKILVINTGGTFGMQTSERGFIPATGLESRIRAQIPESNDYPFDMVDIEPLIDSADLQPNDWSRIGSVIIDQSKHYSGFLVIHGTDTLAYTAAALSFIFCGANSKPIVVTGSQVPLDQSGSDAQGNFLDSLVYLSDLKESGVYVCFGGKVLLGSRVRKLDAQGFGAFDTPNLSGYVELAQKRDSPVPTSAPEFRARSVALVLIYPGIPASVIDALSADSDLEAIILLAFGSGNLPSFSSDFVAGIERAHQRGILIVNMTQCLRGRVIQGTYATGSALAEIGALQGYDLTPEAAFARMHYLLATCADKKAVVAQWPQPLCDEMSSGRCE